MLCYVMLCSNHIYVNLSHAIIKEYSQSESKKFAASIAVMQRVVLPKKPRRFSGIYIFPLRTLLKNICEQLLRAND